jgi:hypothetical protein
MLMLLMPADADAADADADALLMLMLLQIDADLKFPTAIFFCHFFQTVNPLSTHDLGPLTVNKKSSVLTLTL